MKPTHVTGENIILAVATVLTAALLAFVPFAFAEAAVTGTAGPGSSGDNVSAIQAFLATDASIYPEGLVTGFYGSLTQRAVERFQCAHQIICTGSVAATGYGRVGPATLAQIQLLAGGGTPSPSGDTSAPLQGGESLTGLGRNGVTIHWSTNENASNRIMYGTVWPFLFASAPVVSDPNFDTSADITLTGLNPSSVYYYVRESIDSSGNVMQTTAKTFSTTQ
jgi:peptidoglycan hydrolase-like protein with peptidoglycan-binding domain